MYRERERERVYIYIYIYVFRQAATMRRAPTRRRGRPTSTHRTVTHDACATHVALTAVHHELQSA